MFLKIYYGGDEMSEEDKEKDTKHKNINPQKPKIKPLEAELGGTENGIFEIGHARE
ncbi:hypothetical protein C5S35_18060 [Candidatus Methanophagaceae archaeon]|nr:hypothetical protein C5S35_18060 [Methanophagales archaeon]